MDIPFIDPSLRDAALQAVGYLGSYQIDFTTSRARADGRVGVVLGLEPVRLVSGIDLGLWDRVIRQEDFATIDAMRQTVLPESRSARFRYQLKTPTDAGVSTIESLAFIQVDQDGHPLGCIGTLFDAAALSLKLVPQVPAMPEAAVSPAALDALTGRVMQAGRDARALGLHDVEADLAGAARRLAQMLTKRLRRMGMH